MISKATLWWYTRLWRDWEATVQTQTKKAKISFFAVLVDKARTESSENGTVSLWLYATSSDGGSQKDSEICLTTISLLFCIFGAFWAPFLIILIKFWICEIKNGVIRLSKFLKTPFDFFNNQPKHTPTFYTPSTGLEPNLLKMLDFSFILWYHNIIILWYH